MARTQNTYNYEQRSVPQNPQVTIRCYNAQGNGIEEKIDTDKLSVEESLPKNQNEHTVMNTLPGPIEHAAGLSVHRTPPDTIGLLCFCLAGFLIIYLILTMRSQAARRNFLAQRNCVLWLESQPGRTQDTQMCDYVKQEITTFLSENQLKARSVFRKKQWLGFVSVLHNFLEFLQEHGYKLSETDTKFQELVEKKSRKSPYLIEKLSIAPDRADRRYPAITVGQ